MLCTAFLALAVRNAFWAAFTKRPAAELTERGLVLHGAFLRGRGAYAYDRISEVRLIEEGNPRWFGLFKPKFRLIIRARGPRSIIRSPEIEGGVQSLRAFAAELEARRSGRARVWNSSASAGAP